MAKNKSIIDFADIRASVKRILGAKNSGWIDIVTKCFEGIKAHCDQNQLDYPAVATVEQKLGSLRIHFQASPDDIYIRTSCDSARRRANSSCEHCENAASPQLLGDWIRTLCCWHAHKVAHSEGINLDLEQLNISRHLLSHKLRCGSCGYIGQIAWGASGHRCPACVKRGI